MDDLCLAPFPVTFDTNWTDEWMVWVTVAAAVASFFVALRAWLTSRDAKDVAVEAIRTQERLQDERIAVDYAAALNGAIAEFFREVRAYFEPLESWHADVIQNSRQEVLPDGTELFSSPSPPSFDRIHAALEVVQLFADEEDIAVPEQLDKTLAAVLNLPAPSQWQQLMQILAAVRRWRSGRSSIEETVGILAGLEDSSDSVLQHKTAPSA